jgi:hypothetical protein
LLSMQLLPGIVGALCHAWSETVVTADAVETNRFTKTSTIKLMRPITFFIRISPKGSH